jgi:hypothetical protein
MEVEVMKLTLVVRPLALLALMVSSSHCWAHSWYPSQCCSDRDCMPADSMVVDAHGDKLVFVGSKMIWVSKNLRPDPSQDGRVHICYRDVGGELDGRPNFVAFCLFIPAQS